MFKLTVKQYLPAIDHEGREIKKVVKELRLFGLLIWEKTILLPHGQHTDGTYFT